MTLPSVTNKSTKPVRLVVAGAGLIGQAHIQRVLVVPGAQLAGIVDVAPKVKEQADALGVPWTPHPETMLEICRPDGVVVALPNQFHFAAGMTLVKYRVPILMEKPICDSVEESVQFADAAEGAGVPVLVGHHRRHSPLIQRAKEIIDSGRLGRITAVHGFCWFLKPRDYFEGKGAWRAQPGGGVILINLIHVIDDLRNLCGDIASVQAATSNVARGFPVEETVGIVLEVPQRRHRHARDFRCGCRSVELGNDRRGEQSVSTHGRILLRCCWNGGSAFGSAAGAMASWIGPELVVTDPFGAGRGARSGSLYAGIAWRSADQRDAALLRRGPRHCETSARCARRSKDARGDTRRQAGRGNRPAGSPFVSCNHCEKPLTVNRR